MKVEWDRLGLGPELRQSLEHGRYVGLIARALEGVHPALVPLYTHWGLSGITRGRACLEELSALKEINRARVLDFGCGDGGVAAVFALAGAEATALDNDPARVDRARALFHDLNADVRFILDPDYGDSLPDHSFDIIVCNDVIEHVDDFDRLARSQRRLLHPDGLIYFSVPNRFSAVNLINDPHFRLAGISLLPREWASLYTVKVRRRAKAYHVNRLLGWRETRQIYRRAGLELDCLSERRLRRRLAERDFSSAWKKQVARLAPAELAAPLHRYLWAVSWIFIGRPCAGPTTAG